MDAHGKKVGLRRVEDEFLLREEVGRSRRPAPDLSGQGRTLARTGRAGRDPGTLVRTTKRDRAELARATGARSAAPVYLDPASGKRMIPTGEVLAALPEGVEPLALAPDFAAAGLRLVGRVGPDRLGVVKLTLLDPARADPLSASRALAAGGRVRWAEPHFIRELDRRLTPNDPLFPAQVSHHNTGPNGAVGDADVDAPEAWDTTTGDPAVVIAIIDDGVDTSHPDLAIFTNPGESGGGRETNGIDDDGNGLVDDARGWDFADGDNDPSPIGFNGHGTGCAGIAAAVGNNDLGVSGIAPGCRILPVKIADDSGLFTTDEAIGEAILYAAHFADVLSNSYGGGAPSAFIDAAITDATVNGRGGKGCPVFFASGNNASTWEQGGGRYRLSTATLSGRYRYGFFFYQGPDFAGENAVRVDDVCLIAADGHTHLDAVLPREDFEGFFFPPPGWLLAWNNQFPAFWELSADNPFTGTGGFVSAKSPSVATNQYAWLFTPAFDITGDETFAFSMSTDMPTNSFFFVDVYNEDFTSYIGSYGPLNWEPEADPNTSYPATSPDAIAVGASTDCDRRSDYSQYGGKLDFVAPSNGGWNDIATLDPVGSVGWTDTDVKLNFGGTSSACPMAAGIAALVISRNRSLEAAEVRDLLRATCDRIGGVTYTNGVHEQYGYGRLNAAAALIAASTAPEIHPGFPGPSFVENGPVVAVAPQATVDDPDSLDFDQGRLTIGFAGTVRAGDELFFLHQGMSTGEVGVAGNQFFFSGNLLGVVAPGSNAVEHLVVALTSNATPASISALLRALHFQTPSEDPSPAPRRVRLTLEDGDGDASLPVEANVAVIPVNDPPALDPISDPAAITEDAGEQEMILTGLHPGLGEAQTLTLLAETAPPGLIHALSVLPGPSNTTAVLRYTPGANSNGTAVVTVTADDGQAESNRISLTFTVVVLPVNDAPTFTAGLDPSHRAGTDTAQEIPGWATDLSPGGGSDESAQSLSFHLTEISGVELFAVAPSISPNGALHYTPSGVSGTGVFQVVLMDDGGTALVGVDTSAPHTLTVVIREPVPDYQVSLAAGELVITDLSGFGDHLHLLSFGSNQVEAVATGRTFSVNHGPFLPGSSGPLDLVGVTNVILRAGAGADVVEVGALTNGFPSLELSTGPDNDQVVFSGSVLLSSNASLRVTLADPGDPAGLEQVLVATNQWIQAFGTGSLEFLGMRHFHATTGSVLRTEHGDLTLSGQGIDPAGIVLPSELLLESTALRSTAGVIRLTADRMSLLETPVATTNTLRIAPATSGRGLDLGGADDPSRLHLPDAEFAFLSAGELHLGDVATGNLRLLAPLVVTQVTHLVLASAGSVLDLNTNGMDVTCSHVRVEARLAQGNPPGLFTAFGDVELASGLDLAFAGPLAGAEHDSLSISGRVDIATNATLSVSVLPGYVPQPGQTLRIVTRDGGGGIFAGLPEGALIPGFLGGSDSARVSYVGGDGDDVELTVVDTTPPLVVCPSNLVVQCLSDVPPADPGLVIASDPAGTPVITHVGDVLEGSPATGQTVTRTYRAEDPLGNSAECDQLIQVLDTMPPLLTGTGSNGVAECGQPPVFSAPAVFDACDPAPVLTFVDATHLGTNSWEFTVTRTWTGTDAAGNTASASQSMLVLDTTPPSLACPPGATVPRLSDLPPVVPGLLVATDACDPSPLVRHVGDAASGSLSEGYTVLRTYEAVDDAGNLASCTQTFLTSAPALAVREGSSPAFTNDVSILVFDTLRVGTTGAVRVVTVANLGNADLSVEGVEVTGPDAAEFPFDVTALSSVVPPGSSTTFTVRFAPVTNGVRSASLVITSGDTTASPFTLALAGSGDAPPVLDLPPGPRLVTATSSAGAVVVFTDLALDPEDGALFPEFQPASGSLFPLGDTTVAVTATDSLGSVTTGALLLRVECDPASLVVTGQPASISTPCAGGAARLEVAAEGNPAFGPVTCQWFRGESPVPSGTNTVLELVSVTAADAGDYHAVLANDCLVRTSAVTRVEINCPPSCADDCDGTLADVATNLPGVRLLANDGDPDGDPLSITGVDSLGSAGGVILWSGGDLSYTPPAGFTGSETFAYAVSDGRGGTATGQVTVTVLAAGDPLFERPEGRWTPEGPRLRFLGLPCHPYVLERADTVEGPYQPLVAPLLAPADGWIDHLDQEPPAPEAGRLFYRLRLEE